ncbi:MAG: non-canonical purine NTP pyrophosphatase [Pirellulales bacterium]|nr:non-canonical purine NTP pyrophosphatase [Pirellulales bacterium]
MRLILGTRNRKKGIELAELLAPLGFELASLADFPNSIDVEETGSTFAENARLKACKQARHIGQWVLGEDSGLSVDALQGAPGVYSALFSGKEATDESNNRLLLEKLADTPLDQRAAHYVCHAMLADPEGIARGEAESACHGRILLEARGSGGFGYDPLFEVIEYHRSFGQLGPTVKAVLSHRARAIRQLIPTMMKLVDRGQWKS